jgi:hypothetical protein
MPVTTPRLAVAGVVAAAAVALPVTALAGHHPGGKPSASATPSSKPIGPSNGPELSDVAARLASQLGVSTGAAETALQQLDRQVTSAQLAVIADELGVSPAQLTTALREVKMSFAPSGSPADKSGGPGLTSLPGAAAALASHLGVSLSAAQHAMHRIGVLDAREDGIDSTDPHFIAIAHQLGVSTAQLDHALRAVKESLAR